MEMYVRYHNLPEGVTPDTLKLELANLLEEDGWLTGSGEGYVELELEDELTNPKHGILAVSTICRARATPATP